MFSVSKYNQQFLLNNSVRGVIKDYANLERSLKCFSLVFVETQEEIN